MIQLKALSKQGIALALEKAERYRLLNEPKQAESICLDILAVEPNHQQVLVLLILSLTDQFRDGYTPPDSRFEELFERLQGEYQQFYYRAIIVERKALARLYQHVPHAKYMAYEFFRQAMALFEKAEAHRPAGNDDALLRWNACARMITQYQLEADTEEPREIELE